MEAAATPDADVEAERHKLRAFLAELALAQKVYAGNPMALSLVKVRVARIMDRLAYLDKNFPVK